jgi:glycosyltransferase involved in cell wall biosynthesis
MKASEKNPMVSVVVPTCNSAKTLDICLKSVKEQTYPNIEIILVDNSSIDNTREIAEKYGKVFIKGPERSAQRNFGARQSNGEYLFFLILISNLLQAFSHRRAKTGPNMMGQTTR